MDELRAVVHCSWGRWWARCPNSTAERSPYAGCMGAQPYGRDPHTGQLGGLTATTMTCLRCGCTFPADWPPNAADIWALLVQRPLLETRNWHPPETVDHLLYENIAHGIVAPSLLIPGRPVPAVVDGRLVGPLRELKSGVQPLAIGGP